MAMKNTGTTVVKNGGFLLPDEVLAQCLINQTSFGVAVQEGETFDVQRHKMTLSKENATLVNEGLKDKDCVLFFQTGADPVLDDDIGPMTILEDSSGKPILLCSIDGDLSRYEDAASSHNALHLAAAEISGRVKRIYSQHNGNLKDTLTDLYQDEIFCKDILQMFDGDRGTITFWGVNEDPFHFTISTDETVLNDDFGWVSNFGKVEAKQTEAPKGLAGLLNKALGTTPKPSVKTEAVSSTAQPAASLRQTVAKNRSTTREAYAPPASSAKPAVPGDAGARPDGGTPAVPAQPGTSVPQVGAPDPEEILELEVPNHVKSKHGKHTGWIRKRIPGGILPSDWKDIKSIKVARKKATPSFMNDWERQNPKKMQAVAAVVNQPKVEAPKTASAIPASAGQDKKPVTTQSTSRPDRHAVSGKERIVATSSADLKKDVASHVVAQPSKGIIAGPIPLLSPGPKSKILDILASAEFKAAQDRQAQVMSDPKLWKELEDRIPDIAQQLGLKSIRDTDTWPYEYILKIGQDIGVEAVAILAANWRAEAIHWQQFSDSILADKNDTSGTGSVVQEEPLKATGTDGAAAKLRQQNLQKQGVERAKQSTGSSLRHSVARRMM